VVPFKEPEHVIRARLGPQGWFSIECGCKKQFSTEGRPGEFTPLLHQSLLHRLDAHLASARKKCSYSRLPGQALWILPVWHIAPEPPGEDVWRRVSGAHLLPPPGIDRVLGSLADD